MACEMHTMCEACGAGNGSSTSPVGAANARCMEHSPVVISQRSRSKTNSDTLGNSGCSSSSSHALLDGMLEHASVDALVNLVQLQALVMQAPQAVGPAQACNMLGCELATTAASKVLQQADCSMMRTLSDGQVPRQPQAPPGITAAALRSPQCRGSQASSTFELPLCAQPSQGYGIEHASAVLGAIVEAAFEQLGMQQNHLCLPTVDVVQDPQVGLWSTRGNCCKSGMWGVEWGPRVQGPTQKALQGAALTHHHTTISVVHFVAHCGG